MTRLKLDVPGYLSRNNEILTQHRNQSRVIEFTKKNSRVRVR